MYPTNLTPQRPRHGRDGVYIEANTERIPVEHNPRLVVVDGQATAVDPIVAADNPFRDDKPLDEFTRGWDTPRRGGETVVWCGRRVWRVTHSWQHLELDETERRWEWCGLDDWAVIDAYVQGPVAVHRTIIGWDPPSPNSNQGWEITWRACGLRIAEAKTLQGAKRFAGAFATHLSEDGTTFRPERPDWETKIRINRLPVN